MRYGRKEYEQLGFDDTTASILEVDRVQEVIRRRCERHRVQVVWSNSIDTAVTSNCVPGSAYDFIIKLPAIQSPITKEQLIRTYMYVVHECGHLLRPEVFDISIREQPCPELQAIFNILEDDCMERYVASLSLGDAKVLGEGNAIMCKDGEMYWREQVQEARAKGIVFDEESLKPMICMAIQMMSRRDWDGWSREAYDNWLKCMPEEGMDLTTALVKEGYVDRLRACVTVDDVWALSLDLFDRLYPDKPQFSPPTPPQGKGKGKGQGSSATEGDDGGEGDADGSGTEEAEAEEGEGYVINWKDVLWSQHDDGKQNHGNGGPAGITFEGKPEDQKGVAFSPHNEIAVQPLYVKGYELPDHEYRYKRRGRAAKHFEPCANKGAALGNRVRRYVQSHTRARIRNDRESGSINNQDIARLLMPPVDGGNWNRRVFYDLQRKQAINTAIHILVDWSGSMGGRKAELAAQAAIRAGDVFERQLKMPVMISAFTAYNTHCDIGVVKPFGRRMSTREQAQCFATYCQWHGGNNDADSVLWAYRELMRRKEPRKILLVLSDGAPAGSYNGDYHSALLAATRQIEEEGKIDLYGIGIQSNAVEMYYTKRSVIQHAEEINDALLSVLAQGVKYNGS